MPKALKWGLVIAGCILILFLAGCLFRDKISAYVQGWFWVVDSAHQVPGGGTIPSDSGAVSPFE